MDLYTRLINEGLFIFWDDSKGNEFNLKISIKCGDKKIQVLEKKMDNFQHYFSINHIGSGEY